MDVRVEADAAKPSGSDGVPVKLVERTRQVWVVLIFSTLAFLLLCGALFAGVSGFLEGVTVSNSAKLEVLPGSALAVQRHGTTAPELITGTTNLKEGDVITTGHNDQAFITMFDAGTIAMSFDTQLELDKLRTNRFFQSAKEIGLALHTGVARFSTSDSDGYASAQYTVSTDQADVQIEPNSHVRVTVQGQQADKTTQVVVDDGRATLLSHGKRLEVGAAQMAWASGNDVPQGPVEAQQDLIKNGDFKEQPTSSAEEIENGGLGTAGWLPIRDERTQSSAPVSISVTSERFGASELQAVKLTSQGGPDQYALVGIRQYINSPVDFLHTHTIELTATIKLVTQGLSAGGPRGDVYPLIIRIVYTDADGKPHDWKRYFYFQGADPDLSDLTRIKVPEATWQSTGELIEGRLNRAAHEIPASSKNRGDIEASIRSLFVLKSPTKGQNVAVINAIEVYGYGTQFQSWITGVSLLAR